jgi:hypothetical protein
MTASKPVQPWLLLIHQIPPKPDYFRVKVGRRLQGIGAVAIKNSVYVLPDTEQALDDFKALQGEIVEDGGRASICRSVFVAGLKDHEIERSLRQSSRRAPGRLGSATSGSPASDAWRGRTWVTRQEIFVDRIASAWLIRRFIDPDARFRFVPPGQSRADPGELRFDMPGAEFTHEGDRCTFETLLHRFELDDAALADIAEVVHDIDLADGKFGREDAVGIKRVLAGIAATAPDDATRLERGADLFDGLYAHTMKELTGPSRPTP